MKANHSEPKPGDLVDLGMPWHGHMYHEVRKSRQNRKGLVQMMVLNTLSPAVYIGDAPIRKMRFEGPYKRVLLDGQIYWVHEMHVKVVS